MPNTTCYLLDENEQPVPIGEKGTMWVGGAGVTRGYINLPELTSRRYKLDKFVENGYAIRNIYSLYSILTYCRSRMFNTGDIARWREDGSLDMLGREDDQVKIKVGTLLRGLSTTNFDRVSVSNWMESPVSLR